MYLGGKNYEIVDIIYIQKFRRYANMQIKKGDRFKNIHSKEIYEVVGRWCGDVVLSPQKVDNEKCLIYTNNEMADFIDEGIFTSEN